MINPQPTRNGENASDLVAALVSNIAALHKRAARLSGVSAGYMAESNPCTALPIGFIAKLKVHTREFVFCDRRIECVVANKISPYRPVGNQAAVESGLTQFFTLR